MLVAGANVSSFRVSLHFFHQHTRMKNARTVDDRRAGVARIAAQLLQLRAGPLHQDPENQRLHVVGGAGLVGGHKAERAQAGRAAFEDGQGGVP